MSSGRQWALVAAVVAALGVALAVGVRRMGPRLAPVEVGEEAPPFRAAALTPDTGMRSLADYRGKVVLLNVWATWCSPCRREMPSIERLHREFGNRGLAVVAVSVDDAATPSEIRTFADELGLTFAILHDSAHTIDKPFQITGYPVTFVIDREGRIRRRHLGGADWASYGSRALVASLLGLPAPDSLAADSVPATEPSPVPTRGG